MFVERVSVTNKAEAVIDQLREKHGDLMFHQSGGCCDGSSPMCNSKYCIKKNFALCNNNSFFYNINFL